MAYPNQQAPPQGMGSSNTVFITELRFDPSYIKTIPGIIKIVVIVLNLLGFICIQSSAFWWNARGVYFNIVAQLGLWSSLVLLLMYLCHAVEKYHNIKWLKIEMILYIVLTFLNLIGSTIVVAFGNAGYSAAGGIIAAIRVPSLILAATITSSIWAVTCVLAGETSPQLLTSYLPNAIFRLPNNVPVWCGCLPESKGSKSGRAGAGPPRRQPARTRRDSSCYTLVKASLKLLLVNSLWTLDNDKYLLDFMSRSDQR